METIIKITNIINMVPVEVWQSIGSAIILSPALLPVTRWVKKNRDGLKMALVMGSSILVAFVAFVNTNPTIVADNYWLQVLLVIGQGLLTFALTQPIWYGAVKPLRNKVRQAVADSDKLNDDIRSARVAQ